jgi:hypothetical protein
MKHPLVMLISACLASVSFVGWRMHAMRNHTVNHFGLVQDPSLSFTGGCPSVVGTAGEVLRDPGASADSTLTVLALGDQSTANEPRRLATYTIPTSRKVIEGRGAAVEREERLLQDLRARCESVRPTLVSPIYLGAKQAIADLQTEGCKEGAHCGLWVSTDLEENGVRAVEERINRGGAGRDPLPARLNNSGITVTFCGFAQTAGRLVGPSGREIQGTAARDPHRDDRLQAVWRSLFARPELVHFEPYCPEPSVIPARDAVGTTKGQR